MWFPEWLYERLPLFYFAAGGACLWYFGLSLAGLPSALLFCAAGVRAYSLRRTVRREQARAERASTLRRPTRY